MNFLTGKNRAYLLLNEYRERGVFHAIKRLISFLLGPLTSFGKQNLLLIALFHGLLFKIKFFIPFYSSRFGVVKFNHTELTENVRKFWYLNTPGKFNLEGEEISRKDIFVYGGPSPKFSCPICQKAEWLSRVRQKNMFIPHSCKEAGKCEDLCKKQGDELWANFHQNFDFSLSCNQKLPAPKGILYLGSKGKQSFLNPGCDNFIIPFRRALAYSCQIDITDNPLRVDWSKYDFFLVGGARDMVRFKRPNMPIIFSGHDFWYPDDKIYQWILNWLKPDVLLTVCPGPWRDNFEIPKETKVVFKSFAESSFFTRPNLDVKKIDLLVIGAVSSKEIYQPRINLSKQLSSLSKRYKIEFSQLAGAYSVFSSGGVVKKDLRTGLPIRFLNKWSEYLGSSKYVVFGGMKYPVLVSKYYESLGSGAIPIFPEISDLENLNIKPFEHYIPLSEVEGDNKKMEYYIENYEKFKYIAQNAVDWYGKNCDQMLFEDFGEMIRNTTDFQFAKRLIQ